LVIDIITNIDTHLLYYCTLAFITLFIFSYKDAIFRHYYAFITPCHLHWYCHWLSLLSLSIFFITPLSDYFHDTHTPPRLPPWPLMLSLSPCLIAGHTATISWYFDYCLILIQYFIVIDAAIINSHIGHWYAIAITPLAITHNILRCQATVAIAATLPPQYTPLHIFSPLRHSYFSSPLYWLGLPQYYGRQLAGHYIPLYCCRFHWLPQGWLPLSLILPLPLDTLDFHTYWQPRHCCHYYIIDDAG